MQDFTQPANADMGHDLLFDQILPQFRQRPLRHANERDGRRQSDGSDLFTSVAGKHACRPSLKPRTIGDAIDAIVIETMNDLPHPGGRAIDHLGDGGILHVARRKHDDPGVAAIDGIASLSFQASEFDLFIGSKGAYSDSVIHDAPPGENGMKTPTWRCFTLPGMHQLLVNLPILPDRPSLNESCQL